MIDRKLSRATAEQDEQHRCPLDVGWPGERVDEDFNDSGHAEQDESRRAGQQAKDQEHGSTEFDAQRKMGSELGGEAAERGIRL